MTLEDEFHQGMVAIYEVAAEHGYRAAYFWQMLLEYGGVGAAKRLLAGDVIQQGLMRLWEMRLLDHSMEALVIQEKFRPLFTDAEIAEAHRRLEELDYFKQR